MLMNVNAIMCHAHIPLVASLSHHKAIGLPRFPAEGNKPISMNSNNLWKSTGPQAFG
jgi:hypothetical protein